MQLFETGILLRTKGADIWFQLLKKTRSCMSHEVLSRVVYKYMGMHLTNGKTAHVF